MTNPKPKPCIQCGEPFTPFKSTERACSPKCAIAYAKEKEAKNRVKEWSVYKKKKLDELQPKSYWEDKLQREINKLVLKIDQGHPCISCGETQGKPQAGHYHSRGAHPSLRFNLQNIYGQDYRCNVELSGNIQGFDLGLIEEYGKDYWEYVKFDLVRQHPLLDLSIDDIKEKTKIVRKLLKEYQDEVLNPAERVQARIDFNKEIGIY